jgi:hypothetical protein
MLKGGVTFDESAGDRHLVSISIAGAAARGRQDRFGDLVRKNRQWSQADVVRALEEAGANYGPERGDLLIRRLPLAELKPYVGDLKAESARFSTKKPSEWMDQARGDLGACVWFVRVIAPAPSGKKRIYSFAVEPFDGRVINILKAPDPLAWGFPALRPPP